MKSYIGPIAILVLAGVMVLVSVCGAIRSMAVDRVISEAAEAGAGYWSIDPVTGDRDWNWCNCKETPE